jgi:hypothetical protein
MYLLGPETQRAEIAIDDTKHWRFEPPYFRGRYQNPQQEAERLNSVHEARVKIVPRV